MALRTSQSKNGTFITDKEVWSYADNSKDKGYPATEIAQTFDVNDYNIQTGHGYPVLTNARVIGYGSLSDYTGYGSNVGFSGVWYRTWYIFKPKPRVLAMERDFIVVGSPRLNRVDIFDAGYPIWHSNWPTGVASGDTRATQIANCPNSKIPITLTPPAGVGYNGGNSWENFGKAVAIHNGRVIVGDYGMDGPNPSTQPKNGGFFIYDLQGNHIKTVREHTQGNPGCGMGFQVAAGCGRIIASYWTGTHTNKVVLFDIEGNYIGDIKSKGSTTPVEMGRNGDMVIAENRIVIGDSAMSVVRIYDIDGKGINELNGTQSYPNQMWGKKIAVGCGRIVFGSNEGWHNNNTPGESGNGNFSVRIFDLNGNPINVIDQHPIIGGAPQAFGSDVAIAHGYIFIGNENTRTDAGNIYVYDLDGNWLQTVPPPQTSGAGQQAYDRLGSEIQVSHGRLLASAPTTGWSASNTGATGSPPEMLYLWDILGQGTGEWIDPNNSNAGTEYEASRSHPTSIFDLDI